MRGVRGGAHPQVSDLEWVGVRLEEDLDVMKLLPFWAWSCHIVSCLPCCIFKL